MSGLRYLLLPFSWLYGGIMALRNRLFDKGVFKSFAFDFPIIAVGNLSFGGTGKTPMVEYLIRLLANDYKLATLSRGYKRKTHGYRLATDQDDAQTLGDEPALLRLKYPMVQVAVAEDRALAIPQMIGGINGLQAILMDDAMQHRSVEPGLLIMLTAYDELFTRDQVLPTGTLREAKRGYKRAQFIVVTKCPPTLTKEERERITKEIDPQPGQLVFFAYQQYHQPYKMANNPDRLVPDKDTDVLLVCGIANPEPLQKFLEQHFRNVYLRQFADHHDFTQADMESITTGFQNMEHDKKLIITTEKDAVRFFGQKNWILAANLPIFVQPVNMEFFPESKDLFNNEILRYMSEVTQKIQ